MIVTFNHKQFKTDIITKRLLDNTMSLDEVMMQSGVSKATISRLERGSSPDMDTFLMMCSWLETEPSKYFIVPGKRQEGFKK